MGNERSKKVKMLLGKTKSERQCVGKTKTVSPSEKRLIMRACCLQSQTEKPDLIRQLPEEEKERKS